MKRHGILFYTLICLSVTTSTSLASRDTSPTATSDNSSVAAQVNGSIFQDPVGTPEHTIADTNSEYNYWNRNLTEYAQNDLAQINTNVPMTNPDVISLLGFDKAPTTFEVSILIQATGSLRLRSSDAAGIDDAVLQWHTYCEEYMQDVWQEFGFEKSPFLHSYDWVLIDNTRLAVFFVCVYPKVWGDGPACLSSAETTQNTSDTTDMCSALTLGSFGEPLLSRNTGKLVVTTNQTLLTFFRHRTNAYVLNSVKFNRLSISASFSNISLLTPLQNADPRKSIFDESVAPLIAPRGLFCALFQNAWCPQGKFSTGAGKRCPTGFGFVHRGFICLHYDKSQGTRRRAAAVTYCDGISKSRPCHAHE